MTIVNTAPAEVTDEAEATYQLTGYVEAYRNLHQGPGTSGLAMEFLLRAQTALTELLKFQSWKGSVEAVTNQRVIDVLVQENTDLAESTK
jgi:hypothetical protein